jgi:hypothetical protein
MAAKILFILKRREDYNSQRHAQKSMSTGLYNSAQFMCNMMKDAGFECDIEVAVDNNCIDRLVTQHQPTHVVIEGLWVVPSKFSELIPLHPDVEWIIRLHSDMPFLAGEGMAMDWIGDYVKFPKVTIASNSPRMLHEIKTYASTVVVNHVTSDTDRSVVYLPNYYPQDYKQKPNVVSNLYRGRDKYWIDIACFGAVRPLKNHLTQAVAALKYANEHGKQLRFHINADRVEGRGEPILNNLRGMFQQLSEHNHQLIAHDWQPREQFLELCATMDIGLQCNFSETFNIVTADMISRGVPVVGSSEIPWSSSLFTANPTESEQIAHAIARTIHHPKINVYLNRRGLTKYCRRTKKIWTQYFKEK